MKLGLCAVLSIFLLAAMPVESQSGWGDLDGLLMRTLTGGARMEAAFWLPDNTDPAAAREAIAVAYTHIPGSAGSLSIAVGHFVHHDGQFVLSGPITGVFGHDPRLPVFAPGHMALTMTTLGPNDARCCPTGETMWIIDRQTLRAAAGN